MAVFHRCKTLGIPACQRPGGHLPPGRAWTAVEDHLLGTMTDRELAARPGCWAGAVFRRRVKLGIAASSRQDRRHLGRQAR